MKMTASASGTAGESRSDHHCEFFLSKKRRYCANAPLSNSKFCGNHNPTSNSRRMPCPIDPSHSVFAENMDAHVKKCPLKKQVENLESKPYYSKGINRGVGGLIEDENVSSEAKRKVIYEMNVSEFNELVEKIKDAYFSLDVELKESFLEPDACNLRERRRFYRLIDPRLGGNFSIKGAQKAAQLAHHCLSRDSKARPFMSEVVEALKPLQNLKDTASSSYFFQSMQAERETARSVSENGRINGFKNHGFISKNGQKAVRSLSNVAYVPSPNNVLLMPNGKKQ